MFNPRPCNRCDEKFYPTGPHCRICDKCREESIKKRNFEIMLNYEEKIIERIKKNRLLKN